MTLVRILASLLTSLAVLGQAHLAQAAPDSVAPTLPTPDAGAGIAVVLGGAVQDDNHAVWQRLVELAGGPGARFVVFTSASEQPAQSAAVIVDNLQRHGAVAEFIPVAPLLAGSDYRAAARDPLLVAKVRAARGVYFGGGAQERHTQAMTDARGAATPILAAVWEVYRGGGVVAGSSAGAAIMSRTMFRDAPNVLGALKFGLSEGPGQEMDRGLGFVGDQVAVDQHFLKRGRLGRLLPLMVQKGYALGVGVDENTAAVFNRGTLEVLGESGVLVVDLGRAEIDSVTAPLSLHQARLSYLEQGDRYDLHRRHATPARTKTEGTKLDPNDGAFMPSHEERLFSPEVLGEMALPKLMALLMEGRNNVALGLAFDPHALSQPELGFEFALRRDADTLGYRSTALGARRYTVLNVHLDVTPVRMAAPLYTPLAPR